MSGSDFDEEFYLAENPDVAIAVREGKCRTAWHHYVQFGRTERRPRNRTDTGQEGLPTTAHRHETTRFLGGRGLEIGALESPCPVPPEAFVLYCDRFSSEEARRAFPELSDQELRAPDVLVDVNEAGLSVFSSGSQDFVILSHVIEHVANPIACLSELFRVTRAGGHVVIAAPDKRYNIDWFRGKTSFEHLWREYEDEVNEVSAEHYLDLIALQHPADVALGVEAITKRVEELRARAEHAHVWDSESFRDFLSQATKRLGIEVAFAFEASGEQTGFEYFAILEKR